jgi:hypothetical protein
MYDQEKLNEIVTAARTVILHKIVLEKYGRYSSN